MSPRSRGRKGRRVQRRPDGARVIASTRSGPSEPCDCPNCADESFDPQQALDRLVTDATELWDIDPIEAELTGATFLRIAAEIDGDFDTVLTHAMIPQIEATGGRGAVVILLSLAAVAEGRPAAEASAAAERLVAAGVPRPGWALELAEPVRLTTGLRLADPVGVISIVACSFDRAGQGHALLMLADETDCGAARQLMLLAAEDLPAVLDSIGGGSARLTRTEPPPDELRWYVERSLDARDHHDIDDRATGLLTGGPFDDEEDGPGYSTLAPLMRARMRTLPVPRRAKPPHGGDDDVTAASAVYQIRVGLRGAKPPIWRRLEVPSDINLSRLHEVIQRAFGWHDCHLHVFETPYGDFGPEADSELGHGPEWAVTLRQVAPAAKDRIRYTYDFGDDWEHEILVEKVLDPDPAATYPRCTAGRRAAPPEDCGGIWGYANMLDALVGTRGFDPARFDPEEVNRALAEVPE